MKNQTVDHTPKAENALENKPAAGNLLKDIGLGIITGAADDDPSAIGTYASAGAKFGPSFLWVAPVMFPMMFAVVYLSSKLGQVAGKGLFDVIRDHYPKWILNVSLIGVMIGNTIEAAAYPENWSMTKHLRWVPGVKTGTFW